MAVSKRTRYEVLRRDNHTCRYCGGTAPEVVLTVDHVVPVSLGGSDDPSNLVAACKDCNAGKASSHPDAPLVADVEADALRWAAAIKLAAQSQSEDLKRLEEFAGIFDECWNNWTYGDGEPVPRPVNWRDSIEQFELAGVRQKVIVDAIRVAMTNPRVTPDATWRYFCGICWRRVDEIREGAAARIAAEEGD